LRFPASGVAVVIVVSAPSRARLIGRALEIVSVFSVFVNVTFAVTLVLMDSYSGFKSLYTT
jgi:hypothetical protein